MKNFFMFITILTLTTNPNYAQNTSEETFNVDVKTRIEYFNKAILETITQEKIGYEDAITKALDILEPLQNEKPEEVANELKLHGYMPKETDEKISITISTYHLFKKLAKYKLSKFIQKQKLNLEKAINWSLEVVKNNGKTISIIAASTGILITGTLKKEKIKKFATKTVQKLKKEKADNPTV